MDVSANGDWSTDWLDVALLNQDLLDLLTEESEVSLWKDSSVLDSCEPLIDV